ncbi:MAG: hypothetical protein OEX19_05435 [Gammaproteobacteria bacterium]|nr:hypothetical protein [Gammaproteobacteria bacterium]
MNVSEPGILQRHLTDRSTGRKYVQLIIADGSQTGDGEVMLENFIESSGQGLSGIALKQIITQRGAYDMDYSIVLNTGWADDPTNPTIVMSQINRDTTPEGVGFYNEFEYSAHLGPNDVVTGYYYGIRQDITNSANLNGSNSGGQDIHAFVLRRASGIYTPSGSASLPGPAGMGMGGALGGGAGGAAGGGGGMMMAAANTSGGVSNTTSAPTSGSSSSLVRINGTSTGEGDAPCGSEPLVGLTPGTPPPCSSNLFPPNPGSVGTGNGAGAAAPGGTLTVPPRGSGTLPPQAQPPGAGGAIPMGMGGGAGVPSGGTVSWSAGNEIQVIWIGQVCPGCVAAAMGGMGGASGSFSYQAYENLSTGVSAATRSIFGTAPFTWTDPPFGPQPGM